MKIRGIALVALALLIFITGAITVRRSVKGSNDFDTFYQAGHAVIQQQGIYYTGEYYQVDPKASPFLYPPFASCFFALWAFLPIKISAFLWNFFNIFLFGVCILLTLKILRISNADLKKHQWLTWPNALLLVFTVITFFDNISMAQINILVFAACLAGLYLAQNRKPWLGGILIAFAIMLKVTPIFFILYFAIKRSWKVLAGILLAILVMTTVLPSLIWGIPTNILYHRQFLGRTMKPPFVGIMATFKSETAHPLKKSAEMFAHNHRGAMLLDKNQSLEAGITRLLLKDRKKFGYEPQPIYVARRYEKMPVLFGGISHTVLPWVIRLVQLTILGLLIVIALKPSLPGTPLFLCQIALFFQAMTLLAPWVRSHQFVSWIFSLFLIFFTFPSSAKRIGVFAVLLYGAQALPYGKAAGLGMLANCLLTSIVLFYGFRDSTPNKLHAA